MPCAKLQAWGYAPWAPLNSALRAGVLTPLGCKYLNQWLYGEDGE